MIKPHQGKSATRQDRDKPRKVDVPPYLDASVIWMLKRRMRFSVGREIQALELPLGLL